MPINSKPFNLKECFSSFSFLIYFRKIKIVLLISLALISSVLVTGNRSYAQQGTNKNEKVDLAAVNSALIRASTESQPVVVPPISFVDVNSGRFGKLEINLEDGQFFDTSVEKLHLLAKNFDVQAGTLKSLNIAVQGGHVRDFIFDKLTMETEGDLKFNSGILVNHRLLQFEQPAQANLLVIISQNSLNQFLGSPRTLERLSSSANRKASALAGLAGLVGIKVNQIGLSINSASLKLLRKNQFKMTFASKVGLGDLALPIDGEIQGQFALQDGSLIIADAHLTTAGQEIPQELSNYLLKKINLIPAVSQKSEDIRFDFTDLKIVAGKYIQLRGIAYVSRLRFGNAGS